jgi:hypothetical protein
MALERGGIARSTMGFELRRLAIGTEHWSEKERTWVLRSNETRQREPGGCRSSESEDNMSSISGLMSVRFIDGRGQSSRELNGDHC